MAVRTSLLGKTLGDSASSQAWKLSNSGRDRSCRWAAIRTARSSRERFFHSFWQRSRKSFSTA
jgi:hypothetical protein